jgi:DNA-binding NtrC family response regulator
MALPLHELFSAPTACYTSGQVSEGKPTSTREIDVPKIDGMPEHLSLLIIGSDFVRREPLSARGTVTLGRGDEADICIQDGSVSRLHAKISFGARTSVQDLGSANGTRIKGRRIEQGQAEPVHLGDAIQLGSTTVILQPAFDAVQFRRLCTHSYFEVRLAEEVDRFERSRRGCSILHLSLQRDAPTEAVVEVVASAIRSTDTVAQYGPSGDYEVLLPEILPEQAEALLAKILGGFASMHVKVRSGIAHCPHHGRSAEALIAQACGLARHGAADSAQEVVVRDSAMEDVYGLVDKLAPGHISILLLGETGVGKEVVAQAIHRRSKRAKAPLMSLNCGAFTAELLENELFGHERGAFTGATAGKEGLLEVADGGTVFLDEIGELPAALQVKLLRVLEDGTVMRVGGLKAKAINIRFIAATNRDIEGEVARGRFREDLYYRLAGATIVIPALRARPSEVQPLAEHFVQRACRREGLPKRKIGARTLALLQAYSWPGNIRELRNVIDRAVLLATAGNIDPEHLPLEKMQAVHLAMPAPAPTMDQTQEFLAHDATQVALSPQDIADRDVVLAALKAHAGNQTRAAKALGIARGTLIARMERYGLPRPRGASS